MSWGPKLVAFCQIWGPFSYIWLMCGYHRLSLHSYNRRAKAMELFDELCSVGIASTELDSQVAEGTEVAPEAEPQAEPEQPLDRELAVENHEGQALAQVNEALDSPKLNLNAAEVSPMLELPSANIAFDLTDPTTVVSVILLRRCLRHYVRWNRKSVSERTQALPHPISFNRLLL